MTPSTVAPQRLDSLTSLRGILAGWVVLHHFSSDIEALFPSLKPLEFLWHGGNFAVPGFFILSGYVLSYTYASQFIHFPPRGVFRFWSMRLARIYPVHFVTLMAVLAMVMIGNRTGLSPNTPEGYSVRDFWLNLFLVHTWVPNFKLSWNYPSWSISSEWFAYLLFPFASIFLAKCRHKLTLVFIVMASLVASVVVYSASINYFRELIWVIPTFFGGMAIHSMLCSDWPAGHPAWLRWMPDFLVALIVAACALPSEFRSALVLIGLFGMILSLAILKAACNKWWTLKPLIYAGEISYSLYMTHTIAQKILYKILPVSSYVDTSVGSRFVVLLVYALLVFGLCLAAYYSIEKPFREWVRRSVRKS